MSKHLKIIFENDLESLLFPRSHHERELLSANIGSNAGCYTLPYLDLGKSVINNVLHDVQDFIYNEF